MIVYSENHIAKIFSNAKMSHCVSCERQTIVCRERIEANPITSFKNFSLNIPKKIEAREEIALDIFKLFKYKMKVSFGCDNCYLNYDTKEKKNEDFVKKQYQIEVKRNMVFLNRMSCIKQQFS
jgi:hypothetical protein